MGEKIKIKDIEGDSDALISVFQATDCNLNKYLNPEHRYEIPFWVLILVFCLFVIISCVLLFTTEDCIPLRNILSIICLSLAGCTSVVVHIYWRNKTATTIATIFLISVFFLAIGATTPNEVGETILQNFESHMQKRN